MLVLSRHASLRHFGGHTSHGTATVRATPETLDNVLQPRRPAHGGWRYCRLRAARSTNSSRPATQRSQHQQAPSVSRAAVRCSVPLAARIAGARRSHSRRQVRSRPSSIESSTDADSEPSVANALRPQLSLRHPIHGSFRAVGAALQSARIPYGAGAAPERRLRVRDAHIWRLRPCYADFELFSVGGLAGDSISGPTYPRITLLCFRGCGGVSNRRRDGGRGSVRRR